MRQIGRSKAWAPLAGAAIAAGSPWSCGGSVSGAPDDSLGTDAGANPVDAPSSGGSGGSVVFSRVDAASDPIPTEYPGCAPNFRIAVEYHDAGDVPCSMTIPALPEPFEFFPDEVNVMVETVDEPHLFPYVGSFDQCATDAAGWSMGWYYDNPERPTLIGFCPETCDVIRERGGGFATMVIACRFSWL